MDVSREIYLHFFASDDKIKVTLWANAIFSSKTKPKYYADETSAKSNLLRGISAQTSDGSSKSNLLSPSCQNSQSILNWEVKNYFAIKKIRAS